MYTTDGIISGAVGKMRATVVRGADLSSGQKRSEKMQEMTELPFDILNVIFILLATTSTNGARDLVRISTTCKKLKQHALCIEGCKFSRFDVWLHKTSSFKRFDFPMWATWKSGC
ncbi:F-box domain, cyclin-like protein [Tanacetum coccineum]